MIPADGFSILVTPSTRHAVRRPLAVVDQSEVHQFRCVPAGHLTSPARWMYHHWVASSMPESYWNTIAQAQIEFVPTRFALALIALATIGFPWDLSTKFA